MQGKPFVSKTEVGQTAMSASRSTSVLGFIATVCLAVTPALAQTELAWCATNLTVFATGGARVE